MKTNFFKTNQFILIVYILMYLSLILGFIYNEDMAGGGALDRSFQKNVTSFGFVNGIKGFLFNFYPTNTIIHSPIYYILIHKLENIINNESVFRFFFLNIFLLIPLILIKILKKKFTDSYIVILIPLICFLSPNFRTVAIWSGREILTIGLLSMSIFYYIGSFNNFSLRNIFLSFLFLICASYISWEYGFISIIYFVKLILNFKKKFKISLIFLFNLILSLPFFIYVIKFMNIGDYEQSIILNIFNNIPYFFSIYFFYTLPFLFLSNSFINYITKNNIFFFVTLVIFYIITQYTAVPKIGGGIFIKILEFLGFSKLIFIFSAMGVLSFFYLCNKKLFFNILVLMVLILQTCISYHFFQKYIDLIFIIYFLFLFKINHVNEIIIKKRFTLNLMILNLFYLFLSLVFRVSTIL
jgi:hypothetical protein